MPPKKPTATSSKAPAKTTTGTKPGTKTTTGAKPAAKTPAAKGAAKPAEKKEEPAPAPAPIVWTEVPFKQIDAEVVYDKEEKVLKSGKFPIVVDTNSLLARFLRHRDVNMLTVMDENEMRPEAIRMALLGSLRFGKPFVMDMMESEMYEFLRDKFNAVQDGLLDTVLSKEILKEEKFITLVKSEDDRDYASQYNYNVDKFNFIIISAFEKPHEDLVRKMYPVKVV